MEKKLNSVCVSKSNVPPPAATVATESSPPNVFRPIPTSMEHLLSGLRVPSDSASAKNARVVELESPSPSLEQETHIPGRTGLETIQDETTDLELDPVRNTTDTPETKPNVPKQHATRQRKKHVVEEDSDEECPP